MNVILLNTNVFVYGLYHFLFPPAMSESAYFGTTEDEMVGWHH